MKQQTAVEWLIDEIESKGDAWENASIRRVQISIDVSDYLELKRQAKQMEKEQVEISDEEILKAAKECVYEDLDISVGSFELGARWYREQLKKK